MQAKIHEVGLRSMIVIGAAMLALVLAGYAMQPEADEGTAAHLFQLFGVLGLLSLGLFLATTDRGNPKRELRRLLLPGGLVAIAFGALYYLEHVYYLRR